MQHEVGNQHWFPVSALMEQQSVSTYYYYS